MTFAPLFDDIVVVWKKRSMMKNFVENIVKSLNSKRRLILLNQNSYVKFNRQSGQRGARMRSFIPIRASIFSIIFEIRIRIFSNPKLTNPVPNPKWVLTTFYADKKSKGWFHEFFLEIIHWLIWRKKSQDLFGFLHTMWNYGNFLSPFHFKNFV